MMRGAAVSDLRYVLRQLFKSPLFFCAAVATLAIGTGATTAIFSAVNATLLRPIRTRSSSSTCTRAP
jgi:hypothetical protein